MPFARSPHAPRPPLIRIHSIHTICSLPTRSAPSSHCIHSIHTIRSLPTRSAPDARPQAFLAKGSQLLYYTVVVALVGQLTLMLFMKKEGNRRSGRALLLCLFVRLVPAVILRYSQRDEVHAVSLQQTVSDGLFLSILTSDIIVAKIADRPIHGLVVVMSMASIMSNLAIYLSLFLYVPTGIEAGTWDDAGFPLQRERD